MKSTTATAIFRTDLASEASTPPEWIELFPAGPEIHARDGRRWRANPEAVIAAFRENRAPLPIDYEHAQDIRAEKGEEAPASGWIVDLENRGGAVWGRVEWTERAAAMIAAREYRFISPAFGHTKGGLVTRLFGAGLVNRPALEMTALSRETPQENHMKSIAKALGLDEASEEKSVLAAIQARANERTALCQALKLDPATADQAAVLAAIAKAQTDLETALASLASSPDKAEYAAIRQSLDDTSKALAALQKKDADREIDAALDDAQKAGKITPASRDTYRAMCAVEGGLDRFRALAATLPVICEPTALDGREPVTADGDAGNSVALAAQARKYQADQLAAGREIDIATAVLEVEARQERKS